jgi:hypothetical protein
MISAAAALHSEALGVFRGPRERRVVWDVPREVEDGGADGDWSRVFAKFTAV